MKPVFLKSSLSSFRECQKVCALSLLTFRSQSNAGGVTTGVVSCCEKVNPRPGSEGILLLWMSTASLAQAPLQGEKKLGYPTLFLYCWLADTWMSLGVLPEIIHKQRVWQYTSLDSAKTTALWLCRNPITEQSLVFPVFVPLHTERIMLIFLSEQLLSLKSNSSAVACRRVSSVCVPFMAFTSSFDYIYILLSFARFFLCG